MHIHRKGYTRQNGTRVHPTTFNIVNRGAPGRGPKLIPPLKRGALSTFGYSIKKSNASRRTAITRAKKNVPVVTLRRRLQVLATLFKRTNPMYSKRALKNIRIL